LSNRRNKCLALSGAALLTALLTVVGCTGPDDGANPPAPTGAGPPSTTEASPTPPDDTQGPTLAPIPDDAVAYADALILAWRAGEQDRVAQLAEPEVLDALAEYGAVGGPHWQQVAHDAGAGSVFVSYENTDDGTRLELRVRNEAASNAEEHAVAEARFDG